MAKMTISPGLQEFQQELLELAENTTETCKEAVYNGASILADAIREEIKNIPAYPDSPVYIVHKDQLNKLKGLNKEQKQGLLDGLGIAHIWYELGSVVTQIGFAGYNSVITEKFPKGQPNALIARALISGSSVRKRNDFISKAIKKASAQAEKKMIETIDNRIFALKDK